MKNRYVKLIPHFLLILLFAESAVAGNKLSNGTQLNPGQSIVSNASKYSLIMQTDGSLVMYRNDGTVRWRGAKNGWIAAMQTDGNFVEYNGSMSPLWASNTARATPVDYNLYIQDDGNLVIYDQNIIPQWNIGAEPGVSDAKLAGDIVGRDLDSAVGGFLGHVAVYDGGGNVIEAEPTGLRVITYNQFKSTTHNFWGAASPAIPSGLSTAYCYNTFCPNADSYQQLEMRQAIVKFAYQQQLLGASYTTTAIYTVAQYGDLNRAATRGVYRCDTFVLASMAFPSLYVTFSTARQNWTSYASNANGGLVARTPSSIFEYFKAYK